MSDCRSSRSWVIGEGHVDIHEARIKAVAEIESLEAELVEARRELAGAQEQFAAALRARNTAHTEVERVESRLRAARRSAVYRLSSSSDISRPAEQRGPEHDLDDVTLDSPADPRVVTDNEAAV